MNRKLSPLLGLLLLTGCAARSTVSLVQAEQAVYLARQADAPERATFEWTLAEQYMSKAREEWGHSDYEASEDLARKALSWAEAAERAATDLARVEEVEGTPNTVPDDRPDMPEMPDAPDGTPDLDEEPRPVIESEQVDVPVWDVDEDEQ